MRVVRSDFTAASSPFLESASICFDCSNTAVFPRVHPGIQRRRLRGDRDRGQHRPRGHQDGQHQRGDGQPAPASLPLGGLDHPDDAQHQPDQRHPEQAQRDDRDRAGRRRPLRRRVAVAVGRRHRTRARHAAGPTAFGCRPATADPNCGPTGTLRSPAGGGTENPAAPRRKQARSASGNSARAKPDTPGPAHRPPELPRQRRLPGRSRRSERVRLVRRSAHSPASPRLRRVDLQSLTEPSGRPRSAADMTRFWSGADEIRTRTVTDLKPFASCHWATAPSQAIASSGQQSKRGGLVFFLRQKVEVVAWAIRAEEAEVAADCGWWLG